jgi:predicted ATPase
VVDVEDDGMASPGTTPALRRITLLREAIDDPTIYPFSVPAIAALTSIEIRSRVVFFAGENGSGKSTLLEALALACGFGREGGTRNFSFSTQNERRDETNDGERAVDALAEALRLSWGKRQRDGFFLRAESFYNVASYLDRLAVTDRRALNAYGGISLHARSHGESFLTLLLERFSGNGLYLIDEPEAALSAARQLALLARMRTLIERDEQTQFIIATHSPIVLAYPGAQILAFDRGALQTIAYTDTDAYVITRRFLHDPKRALQTLFTEDDTEDAP